MNDNFPKVMVFSNNCFSDSGSNGRTLANFFLNWPSKNIAQFYIKNEMPSCSICNNYFRVTDAEAVKSFFSFDKRTKNILQLKENREKNNTAKREVKRTPLNVILRDFIWRSMRWRGEEFDHWIQEFNPDIILLQAGDSPFMLNLATKVAQKLRIPLVIYNSESYYFKKKNYMTKGIFNDIFYFFFRVYLRYEYKKTMKYASHSIYISDLLRKAYDNEFNKKSTTLMTVTEYQSIEKVENNEIPIISYLGNLGLGRIESLIKIANTLQDIDSQLYLNIYGNITNEQDRKIIEQSKGIKYHGLIPYKDVIKIMHDSDILLHVENFSDFYKDDLLYGFSTKIADSLASGRCFFVYAPKEIAFCDYLKENEAAWVVNSEKELIESLKVIIEDINERNKYIDKAKILANKNHNKQKNGEIFLEILKKEVIQFESITN